MVLLSAAVERTYMAMAWEAGIDMAGMVACVYAVFLWLSLRCYRECRMLMQMLWVTR
jgi:hypothetical protein